jgi:hypothetical protein
MAVVFECLGCGTVSLIEANPPRCPQCGHGNGLTQQPPPQKAAPQDAPESKEE